MQLYIVLLILLGLSTNALCAAWTQPKGKAQLISQMWITKADTINTRYNPYNLPIYTSRTAIHNYFEYGLTNRISIGLTSMSASQQVTAFSQTYARQNNALEQAEFFLKYNLIRSEMFVLTTQMLYKIPGRTYDALYPLQSIYRPGYAYETRLMLGIGSGNGSIVSAILGGDGSFFNAEFAYRKNLSGVLGYDEIRSGFDLGIRLNDPSVRILLFQIFRFNKVYISNEYYPVAQYNNCFDCNGQTQFMASALFDIGNDILVQFGLMAQTTNKIARNQEGDNIKGFVTGIWF